MPKTGPRFNATSGVRGDWTDKQVAHLRQLWGEGLSVSQIGRTMNLSKNAVMGKVHRLGFKPRPSSIKRDPNAVPKAPIERAARAPLRVTLPGMEHAPKYPARIAGTYHACQFPLGEKPYRFCNAASVPGKPYCAEHCAIAYVRRREDAA